MGNILTFSQPEVWTDSSTQIVAGGGNVYLSVGFV